MVPTTQSGSVGSSRARASGKLLGTGLVLHDAGQVVGHHRHLLLLHLEGQQRRALAALDEEEPVADRPDGADHQPLGREVVAVAHAMASSVRAAVEFTVRRYGPDGV